MEFSCGILNLQFLQRMGMIQTENTLCDLTLSSNKSINIRLENIFWKAMINGTVKSFHDK